MLENLCYVAESYHEEVDRCQADPVSVERSVPVPGGPIWILHPILILANSLGGGLEKICLGMERFEISEGIFKPEVWGLDQAGVHVLVKKAIAECSLDVRREVTQSIFLSGGLTMLPGFKQRLEAELAKLLPAKPRVHASPYR